MRSRHLTIATLGFRVIFSHSRVEMNDISYKHSPNKQIGLENQEESRKGQNLEYHNAFKYPCRVVTTAPEIITRIENEDLVPAATRIFMGKYHPKKMGNSSKNDFCQNIQYFTFSLPLFP